MLEIGVGESIDNANLEEVQAYNYDLIYGIAGVLYYSLNTHKIKEKTIYNMINFLVELYRIKSHDWGSIIRYHIEKDKLLLADEKVKYPKGCINFGLAHGIIAPLIALAKAKKYGYNVKGINATISGLRQLYEKYSVRDMNELKESISIAVDTMEELKKINNNDGMNKKKLKEIQDKEHRGEPFETLNIWNAIVTEQLKELLNRACEVQRVAGAWAALIAGPTVMSAIDIVYETEVDEFDNEELYTQGAYFILRAIMKMHGTEI